MMRTTLIVLGLLFGGAPAHAAQLGYAGPVVGLQLSLSTYPTLQRVPGYPVYYAPGVNYNYFFYDGSYWLFQDGDWFVSNWYNGPWMLVEPDYVPLYVLRVPVRYYRAPPVYFRAWRRDGPPRWGEHWGGRWEQQHRGWDHWNRRAVPAPAPLPVYQRQYGGHNYPSAEQQRQLQGQHYHYQPRDAAVREHLQAAPMPVPQAAHPGRASRAPLAAPAPQPSMMEHGGQRPMPAHQPVAAHAEPRPMPPRAPMAMPPQAMPPQAMPPQAMPAPHEQGGRGHEERGRHDNRGHDEGDSGPGHDKGKH